MEILDVRGKKKGCGGNIIKTIPTQAAWKSPIHCDTFGRILVEDDSSIKTYSRLAAGLFREMVSHDMVTLCGEECPAPKRQPESVVQQTSRWAQETGSPCSITQWPFIFG